MRTRATRSADLDRAVEAYLLDGDLQAAADDLRAREQPTLLLWRHEVLAPLWKEHQTELLAEAARRGIKQPWWLQREAERRRRDGHEVAGGPA